MKAVGVYIFAGGFTLGVEQHFDVLAHFEDKPYAGTDTFMRNRPNIPVHFRVKGEWEEAIENYDPDFIYCNPPCAVFSPIGISITRGSDFWRQDPRINCWLRSYGFIEKRPKILAIESVPQALTKGEEMIRALCKDAFRRGYSVTLLLHDAAHQGAPHHRKRFFFIAHRIGLKLGQLNWMPAPSVGETLSKVPDPGPTIDHNRDDLEILYPMMQRRSNGRWEGVRVTYCRWKGIPTDAKDHPKMPMFMLHRLTDEEPPGAFTGNYWLHPHEPRYIGINEMKALTGYPLDYELAGSKNVAATLLAQAVMPAVGEWIARYAKSSIVDNVELDRPRVMLHDLREAPGSVRDVTDYYAYNDVQMPAMVEEKQPRTVTVNRKDTSKGRRIPITHDWLDKAIKVKVQSNPRRPGSATHGLFEMYAHVKDVREFLERGGRLVDIKHDLERDHIELLPFIRGDERSGTLGNVYHSVEA